MSNFGFYSTFSDSAISTMSVQSTGSTSPLSASSNQFSLQASQHQNVPFNSYENDHDREAVSADIKVANASGANKQQLLRKMKKHARPGRKAKRADSELSEMELAKRELRRERNKEAARRCRQRRLDKTRTLEDEVNVLQHENHDLEYENYRLRQQLEHLRYQVEHFCHSQGIQLPQLAPNTSASAVQMSYFDENAAAFPALAAHPPLAKQFNNCQSAAVNYSHNYKNEVHYQGRIVSQTASGVRKEVSLENKEQTIFMSL
ncbi:unnamed protein product [Oikopleura dioica]|uniref:BZIP domain-containing protein n=1 Tax=Oikopleura dioica TaxID=34765 RepID=E4XMT7_OIKDI|nr:unnamed protein product [Oikopleura dioica]